MLARITTDRLEDVGTARLVARGLVVIFTISRVVLL